MNHSHKAKRTDWNTTPIPARTDPFDLRKRITIEEYDRLRLGLIPEQMEDKWFIFVENDVIHFHRSWTGFCIYRVEIGRIGDQIVLRNGLVNRDPEQYENTDLDWDIDLLCFLIDRLLLDKDVPFPSMGPDRTQHPLFTHHMVGHARSNTEESNKPFDHVRIVDPEDPDGASTLPEHLQGFIERVEWTFARTYAKTWPHEYIVRQQVDQDLFRELAMHIDVHGYEEYFYRSKQIYFDHDGYTYWHMDNIINRCAERDTFHRRKIDGRLPEGG